MLKRFLKFSAVLLKLYFLSPLIVYAAIDEMARLAPILAYAQIVLSYLAAITLNMAFALGEEIGWRGYLYTMLGLKTTLKTALIIGVLWGLWHAPATILLGYNYQLID